MTTNSANTANTAIAKEAVETNGAQSQQTDPPTLQLDNVSYAYTKGGKRVLKNISHDFQAGKVHAITGPSGAGKTTLLSLISGLANPTEGMVLVDGTDLSERDRYRFRSHDIGVIFQSFNLLPMFTAEQNILMPLTLAGDKPDHAWFDLLVDTLGLKQRLNHRPNELSGGQQQRVGIARALVVDPKIIFADEPTGNLDSKTTMEVLRLMQRIVREQQQTLVMVTHDNYIAGFADRQFHIVDGKILKIEEKKKETQEAVQEMQDALHRGEES